MSGTSPDFCYRAYLREELARRCQRNARYSVRSFARAIHMDPGALSRVLSGKQVPSARLAEKMLKALAPDIAQREAFLSSLSRTQKTSRLSLVGRRRELNSERPTPLDADAYRVMAEWYHVAIMELTFTKDFQSDARWIAQQIGIEPVEAKLAIERLVRLGLLQYEGGILKKTDAQLTTKDKTLTTPALRRHQGQWLEKALQSLENDPIEERVNTNMTMSIDPALLPIARKMVSEFNQSLCRLLESQSRERVYNLSVALNPVQKKRSSK